jgi:ketopantoate reductase
MEKVMAIAKVDYTPMYLEASKELRMAIEALSRNKFQVAYDHCLNAQTEMRLMTGAVKTWMPINEQ